MNEHYTIYVNGVISDTIKGEYTIIPDKKLILCEDRTYSPDPVIQYFNDYGREVPK